MWLLFGTAGHPTDVFDHWFARTLQGSDALTLARQRPDDGVDDAVSTLVPSAVARMVVGDAA